MLGQTIKVRHLAAPAWIAIRRGRALNPARARGLLEAQAGKFLRVLLGVVVDIVETAHLHTPIYLQHPRAQGLGLGRRLVGEAMTFARAAGYTKMSLWTNDILHAARHIYVSAGFRLVAEEKHHSFGVDLVGQNWECDLA